MQCDHCAPCTCSVQPGWLQPAVVLHLTWPDQLHTSHCDKFSLSCNPPQIIIFGWNWRNTEQNKRIYLYCFSFLPLFLYLASATRSIFIPGNFEIVFGMPVQTNASCRKFFQVLDRLHAAHTPCDAANASFFFRMHGDFFGSPLQKYRIAYFFALFLYWCLFLPCLSFLRMCSTCSKLSAGWPQSEGFRVCKAFRQ